MMRLIQNLSIRFLSFLRKWRQDVAPVTNVMVAKASQGLIPLPFLISAWLLKNGDSTNKKALIKQRANQIINSRCYLYRQNRTVAHTAECVCIVVMYCHKNHD